MTIVLFAGAEQIDFDYDEVGDEEIFIFTGWFRYKETSLWNKLFINEMTCFASQQNCIFLVSAINLFYLINLSNANNVK